MPERDNVALKVVEYGDIWLRDTLPIFVKDEHGKSVAVIPRFNGWGGKYLFPDDLGLATRVANLLLVPKVFSQIVFEGGAIECDGAGTLLTTEQCLLNPNRNRLSKKTIEEEFARLFGAKKIIWLKRGLKNDHTDGHIDTLARFIGPQKVAIMSPTDKTDPNYDVLLDIRQQLISETDAHGNQLDLLEVPSCGAVMNSRGEIMPASYCNFLMGDNTLVVPLYGEKTDLLAIEAFKRSVNLSVVGLMAKAILSGGGAFHCISQEYFR
jgi:agmatine deiminase